MASGFALLSVGDDTVGERASPLICLKGGVRTRMRDDRIQTCRSKLDSDQVNDKVGGTGW
jgi:hypothetical protein